MFGLSILAVLLLGTNAISAYKPVSDSTANVFYFRVISLWIILLSLFNSGGLNTWNHDGIAKYGIDSAGNQKSILNVNDETLSMAFLMMKHNFLYNRHIQGR